MTNSSIGPPYDQSPPRAYDTLQSSDHSANITLPRPIINHNQPVMDSVQSHS